VNTPTGTGRPLDGRSVLVTRPRARADELIARLEDAGAQVVVAPTIRLAPPSDPEPLSTAASLLHQFDWVVFASANGVDALLDAVDAIRGAPDSSGDASTARPKIAAVGTRTAERLEARGVAVDLVPAEFTAEALVEALTSRVSLAGARVLLPRSEIGREVIADGLRSAGAIVTAVTAYRTVAEAPGDQNLLERLMRQELDAVMFTSGSAVVNFVQIYGSGSVDALRHTVVAAIGPVTANAARELGIDVHVQPATYTAAAMVEALAEYFSRRA
jgi:uroporphyrinogen-III synthase